MKTPEEYMTQFAQEHSYESWDELMYDTHDIFQIQYTKELLLIFAREAVSDALDLVGDRFNSGLSKDEIFQKLDL